MLVLRLTTLAFALAMMLGLAGCATPYQLQPGASADQVRAAGRPTAVHPLPDGQRLEFIMGPFQQEAYMVDVDPQGVVRQVRQVRTLENFGRLQIGKSTQADVLQEFGQPWLVQSYPLSKLTAWMYPFKEVANPSMMAVHFDTHGVVQLVQNGPDPRFIGGGNRRD